MTGVIIPATGLGTLTPLISADQVTATSEWVENVQLAKVVGGVLTRTPLPGIGTAGVSSADVISIQGIASGTPIPITGSISVTGTMPVSAIVTAPVFVRLSDGTNPIATLPVSISGSVTLPTGAATAAKQPALGTAGSPSADVITVQGNPSGTPIPVTGSITIAGTMPVSALVSAPVFVRLSDGTNPIATLPTSAPDVRPAGGTITVVDSASTSVSTGQNGATLVTGTPTANSFYSQAVNGVGEIRVQVTGTWTGTLTFEKSIDGGTTWTFGGAQVMSTGYVQASVTGNGIFGTDAGGATHFRVRATAAMTGTASIVITEAQQAGYVKILNSVPLRDNTSGSTATVKPASTAPLATDTALVVTLRDGITVTGTTGLTDTQLRASAVPVSLTSVPSHAVTNTGTFAIQDSQKIVDNAAFTDGTTPVQPVGFIYDEVAGGTPLTEDDAAAARVDLKRAQVLVIEDATTRGQRVAVTLGDTGNNGLVVVGARKEVAFTTTTVQAVGSTDASNYAWVSVQIASQGGSSTVTFQASNDNATWVTTALFNASNGALAATSAVAAIYHGPLAYRYFRLNVTGIASGTTAGVIEFFANPRQAYSGGFITTASTIDGAASSSPLAVASASTIYNGNSWDRARGNVDATLLASAARTTTQTVADQTNYNGRGVTVTLDVTVIGTGSITLEIDGKDTASGKYVALLTGVAVTANGTTQYTVYPGVTAAANAAVSMILPRTWRVVVTANNANSVTYSVGASTIL